MNFLQLKITFRLMHAPWGHKERQGREREREKKAQPQKVRCLPEMALGSLQPRGGALQH